jgi:hypothetical protein
MVGDCILDVLIPSVAVGMVGSYAVPVVFLIGLAISVHLLSQRITTARGFFMEHAVEDLRGFGPRQWRIAASDVQQDPAMLACEARTSPHGGCVAMRSSRSCAWREGVGVSKPSQRSTKSRAAYMRSK